MWVCVVRAAVAALLVVVFTAGVAAASAQGLVGYIVGGVAGETVESILSHDIPVKRVCGCACRMVNEPVIVLVEKGKPVLVVESGAVFNGTIPPARGERIPLLERSGAVVYVDRGKYAKLVECAEVHRCVEIDKHEAMLLLLAAGAVLVLTVHVYNKVGRLR